jgi:hypothetical protein
MTNTIYRNIIGEICQILSNLLELSKADPRLTHLLYNLRTLSKYYEELNNISGKTHSMPIDLIEEICMKFMRRI